MFVFFSVKKKNDMTSCKRRARFFVNECVFVVLKKRTFPHVKKERLSQLFGVFLNEKRKGMDEKAFFLSLSLRLRSVYNCRATDNRINPVTVYTTVRTV